MREPIPTPVAKDADCTLMREYPEEFWWIPWSLEWPLEICLALAAFWSSIRWSRRSWVFESPLLHMFALVLAIFWEPGLESGSERLAEVKECRLLLCITGEFRIQIHLDLLPTRFDPSALDRLPDPLGGLV